jgi:hypothetical protein
VTAAIDAQTLLRAGVLEGVSLLCAGESGPFGDEIVRACEQLGARVRRWSPGADAGNLDTRARADADVLCYDGAATFAGVADEREALDACLALAWEATRENVAAALLEEQEAAGGPTRAYPARIVYVAPPAGSRVHADAARAGLENLARTLSIEWARHGVSTVAIAPGLEVTPGEVAALVAYLASPAGGYFSGCLLDLTGPGVSLRS